MGRRMAGKTSGRLVLGALPGFAECWAFLRALTLADLLGVRYFKLLIDNLNVVNFLKATGKSVSFISRDCPFLWQRVRRMLLKLEEWEVEWIPSHGKKPNWSAMEPTNTGVQAAKRSRRRRAHTCIGALRRRHQGVGEGVGQGARLVSLRLTCSSQSDSSLHGLPC